MARRRSTAGFARSRRSSAICVCAQVESTCQLVLGCLQGARRVSASLSGFVPGAPASPPALASLFSGFFQAGN